MIDRTTKINSTTCIDVIFITKVVSPDITIIPNTPLTSPYPSKADKYFTSNISFIYAFINGIIGDATNPIKIIIAQTAKPLSDLIQSMVNNNIRIIILIFKTITTFVRLDIIPKNIRPIKITK